MKLVFGATGRIGGACARRLLQAGERVRAVTRYPRSPGALALEKLGAEIVAGNLDEFASLAGSMQGIDGIFCVLQSFDERGRYFGERDLAQGRAVVDAASNARVRHLVFVGCGPGVKTGVAAFDHKLAIADYMVQRGLAVTLLLPSLLMDGADDILLNPPLRVFGVMPKIVGWDTPLPWVASRDVGLAASTLLTAAAPEQRQIVPLVGEMAPLSQVREAYKAVHGRSPRRLPLPAFAFQWLAGSDLIHMWKWWASQGSTLDSSAIRQLVQEPMSWRAWLKSPRRG